MKQKIKQILIGFSPVALVLVAFFLYPDLTHAQGRLGSDWARFLGDLPTFQGAAGTPGQDLAVNFIRNGIRIFRNIIGAVALVFAILYGFNLILARGQEEKITKQKQNFLWAFVGFLVLMISDQFASILNPETSTADELIRYDLAQDQLRNIANYLKWMLGSVIVLLMTVSGVRLVLASGDEERITKEKRHLVWGGIGMLTVLLANNIVDAIYVVNDVGEFQGAAGTEPVINEVAGVIRLILVFLGPAALVFTIYAGFLYLTSFGDEERNSKAKRMIIGGITGVIMIYAAFAIVNTFIRVPVCGNGTVEQGEQCDDGNLDAGDECTPECQLAQ